MTRGGKPEPATARLRLSFAVLLFTGIISYGHSWNLPNTNYPGTFDGTFGGNRGYSQASAAGASWNQGQFKGGPPGAIDQTVSSGFGNNPWSGDGRPLGTGGAGGGLSSAGYNGAVGGGFGAVGNDNGAAFGGAPGQGFGYNGQFPTGSYQGENNGGSAGSFGGAGTGPTGPFDGTGSGTGSSLGGAGARPGGILEGGGSATGPGSSIKGAGQAGLGDAGLTSAGAGSSGDAVPGRLNNGAAPVSGPNWSTSGTGPRPLGNSAGPGGSIAGAGGAPGSSGASGIGTGFANGVPTVPLTVFGVRPAVPYYGNPQTISASYPKGYGNPTEFGGYSAGGHPWYGVGGYVYRMPVAHINPDGSYAFSYQTPDSTRKEVGDSDGNVEGNYGFNNDGAKHNFSFSAGPDVDLRSSIGQNPSEINPANYGPQSVHSRARLPFVPRPTFEGVGTTVGGFPETTGRPQGEPGASWANRNGMDGARTGGGVQSTNGPDDSALHVLGLPTTSPVPSGVTTTVSNDNPNAGNRLGVVRNTGTVNPTANTNDRTTLPGVDEDGLSTEVNPEDSTDSVNSLRGSFPYNGEAGRLNNQVSDRSGALSTPRPLQAPVEPVITRPENDPSYNFGHQTPTATREESAGRDGTVRGSFAYNNEAGRNDLQYRAGAGTGFRPTGGSLAVPNGLRNSAAPSGQGGLEQPVGPRWDGSYQFGNQAPYPSREAATDGAGNIPRFFSFVKPAGRNDLQYVADPATGFRPTGTSLSVPNGGAAGGQAAPTVGGFGGPGSDGRYQFGYRAPDSEREESSDGAGNVRGSYAYNNEAGRNDLQYVAGAGTGFRPTGGSLSVPNGLGFGGPGAGSGGGFGGTFNNRGGLGGQSFLPASSSGSNALPGNENGVSTYNTFARSPQDVLPPGRWNTGNGAFATTTGSLNSGSALTSRNVAGENTTGNIDDMQQTTTFGDFDVGTGANPRNDRF
uniref:Uncharacterized protein n=1 Tax=Anopheles atroparvus TaxID=41427 RepID=A0A182JI11_ANOAO